MRVCLRAREASLPGGEAWRLRGRTLIAMALLCVAQLTVKLVPFRYWRSAVGQLGPIDRSPKPLPGDAARARRLAVHVERAAARLPIATKCLPRAMALCWLLRRAGIAYVFKIAARPAAARQAYRSANPDMNDTLHAWVEAGDATVIGALPGPWLVVLILFG